jgi:hypothetical protein
MRVKGGYVARLFATRNSASQVVVWFRQELAAE